MVYTMHATMGACGMTLVYPTGSLHSVAAPWSLPRGRCQLWLMQRQSGAACHSPLPPPALLVCQSAAAMLFH